MGYRYRQARNKAVTILASVTALPVLLWVLSITPSEYDTAIEEERHYCEMVTLNKQDNSVGWPDYKGIYDSVCQAKNENNQELFAKNH